MSDVPARVPRTGRTGHAELLAHLRRRGVLGEGPAEVEGLPGGVSNDVLAVTSADARLVVKRALRRLRVAEEWLADPRRILTEAMALRVAARIDPTMVPPVIDIDADSQVLVIARADQRAEPWKSALLDRHVDLDVAGRLGDMLARLQMATAGDSAVRREFDSVQAFRQLRIEPFFDAVSDRHPDLQPAIADVVAKMLATRTCLVHGDFSPKNVLVGPSTNWIIDWEVAHYGDPHFDQAFLLTHLICKSLHQPESTVSYRRAATRFLNRYRAGINQTALPHDEHHLTALTACLLLARIDGKSPTGYLSEAASRRGRDIAKAALAERSASLDDIWRTLT